MIKEENICRIVQIVAALEIIGGVLCIAGVFSLSYIATGKLHNGYLLAQTSLLKLRIYILLSSVISFLLAYGLYSLRNWARILLIIFAVFGLANAKALFSPGISSVFIPFFPQHLIVFLKIAESVIFISLDCFLIYFFTCRRTMQLFKRGFD